MRGGGAGGGGSSDGTRAGGGIAGSGVLGARATPLAERLRETTGTPRPLPSWLEAQRLPARTRPLRAHSQPVAPVQPIDELIRSEVEQRVEEARNAAELEGLRIAEERVSVVMEQYYDGIRRLAETAREARRPDAAEVVDLALTVAAELVRREVMIDRDLLVRQIDEALTATAMDRSVLVRVAPEDLKHVRRHRPDLAEAGVTLVEDARLRVGDYEVETPQHVIDGSIVGRLENVRAALVSLVAEEGPVEPDAETE